MKLGELKSHDEVLDGDLTDPEFRLEWERTALARAVALKLVQYRAEHGLSQRELAKRLEMKQPQVARLESGDVNPSIETLIRLSRRLGLEFALDIHPADRAPKLVNKRAQGRDVVASYETDDTAVLLAAT